MLNLTLAGDFGLDWGMGEVKVLDVDEGFRLGGDFLGWVEGLEVEGLERGEWRVEGGGVKWRFFGLGGDW